MSIYVPHECLDPASIAVTAAKVAKNQPITYVPKGKDYSLVSAPQYPNTSLSNLNPKVTPNVANGSVVQTPQENKNGSSESLDLAKLIKNYSTSKQIMGLFGKSGDMATFIKFLKELKRVDSMHYARTIKLFNGVIKDMGFGEVLLSVIDTDLGNYLLKNMSEAIQGLKIIGAPSISPELRMQILKEIHSTYGNMTFQEALTQSAEEGIVNIKMFTTSVLQALNNITGNAVGNMITVFKGGDPISDMEDDFTNLYNAIKTLLK